ncbi:MAG: S16 family serine protease, partial [Planctomycetota bacterium]
KVLAAARVGISRVVLPNRNEKDLEDIPPEVLEKLEVLFVENMDEVLKLALGPKKEPRKEAKKVKPPKPKTTPQATT